MDKQEGFIEFSLLMDTCGFTQDQAAAVLGQERSTLSNYSSGRRTVPDDILRQMKKYARAVEKNARAGRQVRGPLARGVARRQLEIELQTGE